MIYSLRSRWSVNFFVVPFTFALLSTAACGQGSETKATPFEIPLAVRKAVEDALTPPLQPSEQPVRKLILEETYAGRTNSKELTLEYLPGGLLFTVDKSTGASAMASSRLTLGLLELLGSSDSVLKLGSYASVIGKAYIPLSLTSSLEASSTSGVSELTGDLRQVAMAAANSAFSFVATTNTRRVIKTNGMFGSTRNSDLSNTYSFACRIGGDKPARELFEGLRGAYREVTCDFKNVKGPSSQQTFAFLVDSGVYITLSMHGERFNFDYKITGVEYITK